MPSSQLCLSLRKLFSSALEFVGDDLQFPVVLPVGAEQQISLVLEGLGEAPQVLLRGAPSTTGSWSVHYRAF